ncbi:MAG: hypothetical protein GY898_30100 [Proteobacteria bacterium]|nr:hypothetical protein [Pseudomonadota bacterium]
MTASLTQLRDSLVTLHQGGVRGGLAPAKADTLVRLLGEGSSVAEAGAAAGLDARITNTAAGAAVEDLPSVLAELARGAAQADDAVRRLRAAATYPLWLAGTIVFAAWAVGARALPALQHSNAALSPASGLGVGVGLGAAVLLLVALAALVWGRIRVPGLGSGWALVEGYGFVHSVAVLAAAGAPLHVAVRASAGWSRGAGRAAADGLARALEAGTPAAGGAPLLDPFEVSLLGAAAASGAGAETAAAIAEHRRIALARVVPDTVVRIQAVAVLLAGGAVLLVGLTFLGAYAGAIAP